MALDLRSTMNWLLSTARIAGASFPGASSLVQLNAEIESRAVQSRLENLEDPISSLHPDVPEVSRRIYAALKQSNHTGLDFDPEFYASYSRPLAAMEAAGLITGKHTLDGRFACGMRVSSASYIMYLCALFESRKSMEGLLKLVDGCANGKWLDGELIAKQLELPVPVVAAVFDIFVSKGYGLRSRENGATRYMAKV